jgi:uncharacterized peroxidase-related enzyme
MSRIPTPSIDSATGATAELFAAIKKAAGGVPNAFATIGAHGTPALHAILQADEVLVNGSINKQDLEIIKLVVSIEAGCDYCVAAHSLIGKMTGLDPLLLKRIRHGESTGDAQRDALIQLVRTLATTRGTISAEAFAAIKKAGYTDEQLVDISLAMALTAFTNVFNRINDTVLDFPAVD